MFLARSSEWRQPAATPKDAMKTLQIIRVKPNPSGKDRNRYGPLDPAQLGAEWVDFKNTGTTSVNLDGVALYNVAYHGGQGHWEQIMTFRGNLGCGQIVRVHSGKARELSVLRQDDVNGAQLHVFTGNDAYVWNNREGDAAALREPNGTGIDQASYDPNPPEGDVLVRSGNKLVPALVTTHTRGW